MSYKNSLFALTASVMSVSTACAARPDSEPLLPLTEVHVSAKDLDLSRASDRAKLLERSLRQARANCAARTNRSTKCYVDIVVTDGGKPRWLKRAYEEYLANR